MTRVLIAAAALAFATTAAAQQRQTTGQQSLGNALGGGGTAEAFGGRGGAAGELNTEAGTEGVNRDFGDGLVGRGDTADRFVGNEAAGPTGNAQNRADFSALNRQRATPPTPPGSPVRATLRLNLSPRGGGLALPPFQSARLLAPSRAVTSRALDEVGPGIAFTPTPQAAVLTGTARTAHDRKLAEAILRLQPGVRRVENRIVVPPAIPPIP